MHTALAHFLSLSTINIKYRHTNESLKTHSVNYVNITYSNFASAQFLFVHPMSITVASIREDPLLGKLIPTKYLIKQFKEKQNVMKVRFVAQTAFILWNKVDNQKSIKTNKLIT